MATERAKQAQGTNRKADKRFAPCRAKPFSTGAWVSGRRCLPARPVLMVNLVMAGLIMVPRRGMPVVAVRVSERHCRGSEGGYDENSKSFL